MTSGAAKLETLLLGISARARALQGAAGARVVNKEHARQMRAKRAQIPYDSGELARVMTNENDPRRQVRQAGGVFSVVIDLPQAKYQSHRLPKLEVKGFAEAVAAFLYEG